MSLIENDFHVAKRLHEELNGIQATTHSNQNDQSVIELSDEESSSTNQTNESYKIVEKSTHDNQQTIRIRSEKGSPDDYFMPIINTYIDIDNKPDWSLVNIEADIQIIFNKLKKHYMEKWLKNANWTVKWKTSELPSCGSFYLISEVYRGLLVEHTALVRPRIQLISLLFHFLIHLYLKAVSNGSISLYDHDENFLQIMRFLNNKIGTQITACHNFQSSPDEENYPTQWFKCVGTCENYAPFYGVIRSTSMPNSSHSYLETHETKCGGQFFKLFEISRINQKTKQVEKKYLRNVHYMFPKPRPPLKNNSRNHLKTSIQVREVIDITNDNGPKVENLCEVVNIDDEDDEDKSATTTTKYAQDFINHSIVFSMCPICQCVIGTSKLAKHFDACTGYQQKVEFPDPKIPKIIKF
ncbi:CLUMA_CG005454, isoform A [Clunio marinus]|uniref:CLUMA_CG005454, isoform A n=1 Tax=Clunio marinus TaxID=568069 RepID=A0A1J1HUT1_9DIPT|nr:CLUMA_CG005454, isoform A [Clunio marinus]